MTHPRTRSRIGATLAGLVLAALSQAITSYDSHARGSYSGPSPAASVSVQPTAQSGLGPPSGGVTQPAVFVIPDPTLHPGAIYPDLGATELCSPTFRTSSIRPSTSYTNPLKQLELGDGGPITGPSGTTYQVVGEQLPGGLADYELDHLIPLTLGGNPEDPKNLWMEPWERKGARFAPPGFGAETKDVLENRLHREVCAGKIALADAQRAIASDWTTAR
jgi:hypothetical protein